MSRVYLEDKKFYVKNEEGFVYVVSVYEAYGLTLYFELDLVAGIDYINPDISDEQGYVKADRFIEDVQYDRVSQYIKDETLDEALEDNGYEVIDYINPRLQKIIDDYNNQ